MSLLILPITASEPCKVLVTRTKLTKGYERVERKSQQYIQFKKIINEIQVIKQLKYNAVKESENTISQYSMKVKLRFYAIYLNEFRIYSFRNKSLWT